MRLRKQDFPDEAWTRLGELLVDRRVELGYPGRKRAQFARDNGLSHDRTISEIENAGRGNYESATVSQLEQVYRWGTGSIRRVLEGGDPTPLDLSSPPEKVPLGANVDPDVLADLAVASPAAIEAVRAVLKAAKGER